MKGDTPGVKLGHFQVRSKEWRQGSLSWRTQEMISRVNEAFQECLTWYGELNETYH